VDDPQRGPRVGRVDPEAGHGGRRLLGAAQLVGPDARAAAEGAQHPRVGEVGGERLPRDRPQRVAPASGQLAGDEQLGADLVEHQRDEVVL